MQVKYWDLDITGGPYMLPKPARWLASGLQPIATDINICIYVWLVVWNMIFMLFHILGMSSSQLTDIFQTGWNHQPEYIYIYLCTYVCTYWAVGFGSWLMALLTSHLPNMVDGDIPLCCLWWLATKRMFATDQLTIIGNLESKNTIQWKIIRRFCQAKDAMVDPKVKGISTNYIAGIVATITSSNVVYSKWTSLFFEWFPPWNTILT